MIHIDYPNGKKPDPDWIEKARILTEKLKAAPDKRTRDKIIDDNAHVWGEVRAWLEEFSNGKCWFSEAKGICFYFQVEHFRPKKDARDPDRDGYWWRAFDYLNYRLCGAVTNSKKGAYFPLRAGTAPALSPEDNCDDENCLLIDPTRKTDVDLIEFTFGGFAVPSHSIGWDKERAIESIKRYKLNAHPPLLRARETVWNTCQAMIDELDVLYSERMRAEAVGKYSRIREERIEALSRQIKDMTSPNAEFSATARACVLQHQQKRVRKLVA